VSWSLFAVMFGVLIIQILQLPEVSLWALRIIIVYIVFKNLNRLIDLRNIDRWGFNLTVIFIGWLLIQFFRATFYAEGYWMWKNILDQLLIILFFIVIIVSTNLKLVQEYYRLYWKFFLPLILMSFIIDKTPLNLSYVPFSVLMLFFALIPKNKKWYLLGLILFYFAANTQRNDIIKIIAASSIGLSISYLFPIIPKKGIYFAQMTFLILPFILLVLGITGIFNVFKMDEYIKGDYTQEVKTTNGIEEDDLTADTRTFIFENVFYTMEKYDAWIIGRSPSFGDEGVDDFWGINEISGLKGRFGNEVGVMDILLWYGLIGVFIYFLIYVRASYLAIYKSRNRYAKSIGLYVAFLWMWAFIWEKPLFETYFMMDLILLGLCFSTTFRQFNDDQMELWIRGIFQKQ